MGRVLPGKQSASERNGHVRATAPCHLMGIGTAVPALEVTNSDLEGFLDTSNEWIESRTGIRSRRVAEPELSLVGLAARAARAALTAADLVPAQVDTIICSSSSPDQTFPALACRLQTELGCPPGIAFDIQAACSGAVYGLGVAESLIRTGVSRRVLVVSAEIFTRLVDWTDRSTAVLFGDGAGALLVGGPDEVGAELLAVQLGADGSGADTLDTVRSVDQLPSGLPAYTAAPRSLDRVIRMNGREVFRFSTRVLEQIVRSLAEEVGASLDDISLVVPHQANSRILATAAGRLGLSPERLVSSVDHQGNTSSASIPLALAEAAQTRRCQVGDMLCLVAFGAGLTWGGALLRWQPTPVLIDDAAEWSRPRAVPTVAPEQEEVEA